jgi:hypothetical protein
MTPDAEPTLKAGVTSKADAPSTAGPRDESAQSIRTSPRPQDDDSADARATSGTKPAASVAREAGSGSAAAEPAETAKPAEILKLAETLKPATPAMASKAGADDKPPAARDGETGQQRQVTVVPGVPRYHTDNCILIRFMDDDDVQQMSLKAATDAGCTPCGACQPGD